MGYYKKHQGDYYRGDYYRGDLWDDIVGGLESAGSQFVQGAVGGGIAKIGQVLFGATPAGGRALAPPMQATQPGQTDQSIIPQISSRLVLPPTVAPTFPAGAATVVARALKHGRVAGENTHTAFRHVDAWEVRNRRAMNPTNPKALRRALRREKAFLKLARKFVHIRHPGKQVHLKEAKGKRKK